MKIASCILICFLLCSSCKMGAKQDKKNEQEVSETVFPENVSDELDGANGIETIPLYSKVSNLNNYSL